MLHDGTDVPEETGACEKSPHWSRGKVQEEQIRREKNLNFYSLTVAAPPIPHATQSRVSGTFWSEGVKLGLAEVEERCCYN